MRWKKHMGAVSVCLIAGLVMIYLSHSLPRMLPGDFVTAMYGNSDVALDAAGEAELRSLYTQREGFFDYLFQLLALDWGYSYVFHAPISEMILEALPWTLLLMGGAHLISTFFGFILGVEAAWRRGGSLDKACVGSMTVLESVPEICGGVILLMVFALRLGWFPAAGAQTAYADQQAVDWILDVLHHLALPLATLVLAYLPGNFLLARGSMVMVIRRRFVETARAKGLPPFTIRYGHAAANALLPMVTRFGLRLAFMITGALVVETIHAYPGLGTLLFNAIAMRDLPLIQGIVLCSSFMVLAVNMGLEFIYGWLDPRVRHAD